VVILVVAMMVVGDSVLGGGGGSSSSSSSSSGGDDGGYYSPVGAMQMGEDTGMPRTVVDISTLLTSRRIRGRRRKRSKAALDDHEG